MMEVSKMPRIYRSPEDWYREQHEQARSDEERYDFKGSGVVLWGIFGATLLFRYLGIMKWSWAATLIVGLVAGLVAAGVVSTIAHRRD
jgi:hypothetical protein